MSSCIRIFVSVHHFVKSCKEIRLEEGQISVLDLKTEARWWNYAKRWWRGNVVRDMISAYDDRPDR